MSNSIDLKGAAKGAGIGSVLAGVICTGIYFGAVAIGADFRPRDPAAMGMEVLPFYQPFLNCLIAAVVSFGLLALLAKVAKEKAWPIFLGIAGVVFLIELFPPFWAFADMKTVLALELMHVPAGLGVVGGFHYFGRRR